MTTEERPCSGEAAERASASGARKPEVASPIADILNSLLEYSAYVLLSCSEPTLLSTARTLHHLAEEHLAQATEQRPASCVILIAPLGLTHASTTEMRLVTLAAAMVFAALPSALTAVVPTRDVDSDSSGQITFAAAPSESEQTRDSGAADDFARVKLTLGVMSRCPDAVLVETLFDRVLERKTSSGLGDNAPETVAGLVDLRLDYIARFVPEKLRLCTLPTTECALGKQRETALKPFVGSWLSPQQKLVGTLRRDVQARRYRMPWQHPAAMCSRPLGDSFLEPR